jgi:5-methyltetrahydrofolate--homocysteine methyltransferase
MSKATKLLEPHFAAAGGEPSGPKVILATVRGDVHDIGKNLVKMILQNNGIKVIDLGIKVPIERILEVAKAEKPAAIGLSGLLVSSAMAMIDYVKAFKEAGLTIPVLVGGAALTPDFTEETLAPAYPGGKVFYCKDAFDDLRYIKS